MCIIQNLWKQKYYKDQRWHKLQLKLTYHKV